MKEREIFIEALQREDPQDRDAYLREACGGDAQLLRSVENLLTDQADEASCFLDRPIGGEVTVDHSSATLPIGAQVGPYKLREQIGEGGMGVVYVAEQTEPVRRKVALKLIKPGVASRDVVARFEAERQALAMMNHPNIARVFDGGATEAGQPYFVMELVQGLPITEYCDRHQLSTRQRLELFRPVCRAVQHAHQKGIIHRDLKPSNVLVPRIDDVAVPKVIDFGVAKAISQKLTDETVYTQFSQLIGTPLYMSPEQAELGVVDIDTRSDVYSLGVLLYELLTANTPFDSTTLKQAGFDEMRRIIREVEPLRPSVLVSTLQAQSLSTIAGQRRSTSHRLTANLRGELDWLVMKALEKDRNRRYESAGALAADLERYLAGDAVEACPPSVSYRLRKFSRRNRLAITVAGIVFAALAAGVMGTTWQMLRARGAETRAASEAANANAVNQFLNEDLLGQANPEIGFSANVKLVTVIDNAAGRVGSRFAESPLVEASIRHTLGKTYESLGRFDESEEQLQRALELRRANLGKDAPLTLRTRGELAWLHFSQRRYADAERESAEVVQALRRVLDDVDADSLRYMNLRASALRNLGTPAEAEARRREALALAERRFGPDHLIVAETLQYLAHDIEDQPNRIDEAVAIFKAANRIYQRENHQLRLHTITADMADLAFNVRDLRQARALYQSALDGFQELLGPNHPWLRIPRSQLRRVDQLQQAARQDQEQSRTVERATMFGSYRELINANGLPTAFFREFDLAEAKQTLATLLEEYKERERDPNKDSN